MGGGLTSAATSLQLQSVAGVGHTEVWDKARGAGGRMSTSRQELLSISVIFHTKSDTFVFRSSGNKECRVDLGAQYISATPKYCQQHKYENPLRQTLF